MEKALGKIFALLGDTQAYREQLERVKKMPGANRLFARIELTHDLEQREDYLAEVRFALIFAGLGFQVTIEPLGGTGPDLGVSRDGHDAVIEVMRFRKIFPGPPEFDPDKNFTLPGYGNPARDVRKAVQKIAGKFRQVGAENGIIAI